MPGPSCRTDRGGVLLLRTMKRILLLPLLLCALGCFAQEPCRVLFYNVENLFDPIDDPATDDDEYTPEGRKRWTGARYRAKLEGIGRVLGDAGLPAVVGLAEVETRGVLEALVAQPSLAAADYRIAHFDSPDERGVDVALLYRPDRFVPRGSVAVRTMIPAQPGFRTRDILTVWGELAGEPFFFAVLHAPSRRNGAEASAFRRVAVGEQVRRLVDSVAQRHPATKIVVMGDFNDDPIDRSLTDALGACGTLRGLAAGALYNPFVDLFKAGFGTLAYGGEWNLFDQIVVSANLVQGEGLRLRGAPCIFSPPYLFEREGRDRGTPFRTYVGNRYNGGYSDHFPVYVRFE